MIDTHEPNDRMEGLLRSGIKNRLMDFGATETWIKNHVQVHVNRYSDAGCECTFGFDNDPSGHFPDDIKAFGALLKHLKSLSTVVEMQSGDFELRMDGHDNNKVFKTTTKGSFVKWFHLAGILPELDPHTLEQRGGICTSHTRYEPEGGRPGVIIPGNAADYRAAVQRHREGYAPNIPSLADDAAQEARRLEGLRQTARLDRVNLSPAKPGRH